MLQSRYIAYEKINSKSLANLEQDMIECERSLREFSGTEALTNFQFLLVPGLISAFAEYILLEVSTKP